MPSCTRQRIITGHALRHSSRYSASSIAHTLQQCPEGDRYAVLEFGALSRDSSSCLEPAHQRIEDISPHHRMPCITMHLGEYVKKLCLSCSTLLHNPSHSSSLLLDSASVMARDHPRTPSLLANDCPSPPSHPSALHATHTTYVVCQPV